MNTIAILSLFALIVVCLAFIHESPLRRAAHHAICCLVQWLRDGKSLKDRPRGGKG